MKNWIKKNAPHIATLAAIFLCWAAQWQTKSKSDEFWLFIGMWTVVYFPLAYFTGLLDEELEK